MTEDIARQVAKMINTQNELTVQYTPKKILEHERYIYHLNNDGKLLGVVEVKKVQWYQCEIDHLSVDPSVERQGHGKTLVQEAETRACQLGANIVQCSIRDGNVKSEGLFKKCGYTPTVTFVNEDSGNRVTVYQKII